MSSFLSRRLALPLVTLLLAACAGTPPAPQQPVPVSKPGAGFAVGHSKALDATGNTSRHLDGNRNVVYVQNFGGGGVGIGLLLGPLGVAANAAMIDSKTSTEAEAMFGKIGVDPIAAFADAMKAADPSAQPATAADTPKASPYLYVLKTDEERIVIAAALIVEAGDEASKWSRKYFFELDGSYTLPALSAADRARDEKLQRAATEGFEAILRHVREETSQSVAAEKPVTLRSPFLTPRFDFEMTAHLVKRDGDVTWIRNAGGVYALRKGSITLTTAQ